jgi:hypothetical protein
VLDKIRSKRKRVTLSQGPSPLTSRFSRFAHQRCGKPSQTKQTTLLSSRLPNRVHQNFPARRRQIPLLPPSRHRSRPSAGRVHHHTARRARSAASAGPILPRWQIRSRAAAPFRRARRGRRQEGVGEEEQQDVRAARVAAAQGARRLRARPARGLQRNSPPSLSMSTRAS